MVPAPRLRLASPVISSVLGLAVGLCEPPPAAARIATAPTTQSPAAASRTRPGRPHACAPTSKPDPKASKPSTSKPDPKASPTKPDPKASKQGASKTDPKASSTKPDPKASKADASKPDPKASSTKPDPKASKADASKPDPKASKPDASKPAPAAPVPQAPPAAPAPLPAAGGYWLGARLLGPQAAQSAGLAALSLGTALDGAPDGAVVGQVLDMKEAMAWVARWAFAGPVLPPLALAPAASPLHTGPAPVPGGGLLAEHGAIVHALTIRGRNVDGSARTIRWPSTAAELIPADLPWRSAVLLAERAPLFAAPAPRVPPAAERFTLVRRSGSLWILGLVDRCSLATGERVCLRWAQVLARHGDEFHAGYLPAAQVAAVEGWQRGAGAAPRAQLLASGTVGARAQFLLVARTRDGNLHRRTLEAPLIDDAFPPARLRIEGEWATVDITGARSQRIALDASLDARPR